MKKTLVLGLAMLFLFISLAGCGDSNVEAPNTYLPQIMLNDTFYFLSGDEAPIVEISENDYLGRITSTVPLSQRPTQNGQANFDADDAPYALFENGIVVLWNGEWSLFLSEVAFAARTTPPSDSIALDVNVLSKEEWDERIGVTMNALSFSSGGLSLFFENTSDNEYTYGSDYALYIFKNSTWEPVEPIIENWGFTSEGYSILPNSKTDKETVDWRWLFGDLPDGDYKFHKDILFIRKPGDFDRYTLEYNFTLPNIIGRKFDYAALLELLTANGFLYEEKGDANNFLSERGKLISLDNDNEGSLTVYEYKTNEAMESDSNFVGKGGSSIGSPDNDKIPNVEISWVSYPYWFKKDLIIVLYVGEDSRIINLLHESFDFFAGYGYQR